MSRRQLHKRTLNTHLINRIVIINRDFAAFYPKFALNVVLKNTTEGRKEGKTQVLCMIIILMDQFFVELMKWH